MADLYAPATLGSLSHCPLWFLSCIWNRCYPIHHRQRSFQTVHTRKSSPRRISKEWRASSERQSPRMLRHTLAFILHWGHLYYLMNYSRLNTPSRLCIISFSILILQHIETHFMFIHTYIQGWKIPVVSRADTQNFSTTLFNRKAILNLNIYNICLLYLDFFLQFVYISELQVMKWDGCTHGDWTVYRSRPPLHTLPKLFPHNSWFVSGFFFFFSPPPLSALKSKALL